MSNLQFSLGAESEILLVCGARDSLLAESRELAFCEKQLLISRE